ncbi:MAG: hypothetical protein LC637_10135 [Xanthomonadaceae bacterium]|nr:hypothetical protein [Xanthomonadaceae bacterium]
MSVLVDTSVWVGHFKRRNDSLVDLMLRDEVLTHPTVLGELACGTPPARTIATGPIAPAGPKQPASPDARSPLPA